MIKFDRSRRSLVLLLLLTLIIDIILWWPEEPVKAVRAEQTQGRYLAIPLSMDSLQPIPLDLKFDVKKVALGKSLFNDRRLSSDDTVACSSCHLLAEGGSDNRTHSIGINGAEGGINAPGVFNSGFNFVQFWDGRAATLEDQIDGPVNHPKEMGSNWPQVLAKLNQDANYRATFADVYSSQITVANIKDAIATFERSLTTPNSNFDRYLRGDATALSEKQRHGYELFQSYGCIACHQGINIGGNMYERMGLLADYFGDRGNLTEVDMGRFNVTKDEGDRHYFRVPSLRNVAKTAPYFHDGSAKTLHDAIKVMAKYQLGRTISDRDIDDIAAFLNSLSGEYEGRVL